MVKNRHNPSPQEQMQLETQGEKCHTGESWLKYKENQKVAWFGAKDGEKKGGYIWP